jgi:hypothetical protein
MAWNVRRHQPVGGSLGLRRHGLTEIGVAGVQQAWQVWRAWRSVARSSILTSVYDSCISVFDLLNLYIMFVDERFNVNTVFYRCLAFRKTVLSEF